jgi:hypothetical protein
MIQDLPLDSLVLGLGVSNISFYYIAETLPEIIKRKTKEETGATR